MAGRIRTHDWAATQLGPIEQWPPSLRIALNMVLDHPLPMVIAWGPNLVTLYNDAYRSVLGNKPDALGRPFLAVWAEARDIIAPQIDRALMGETIRFENARFMLMRGGEPEETWFDYSYSPLRDDAGAVAGLLNTTFERTGRVLAERQHAAAEEARHESEERQTFLLTLGDALRAQSSTDGLIETAARLIGERLAASRIVFAEFDEARGVAEVFLGWFADSAKPFPTVMRLEDYEGPILDDLRAGRAVRVNDTRDAALGRPDLAAIAQFGVMALLSIPLVVPGRLVVNLSVHQHTARNWTDDEVALVHEVAERLWADLVRARAEAALRESESRLQLALSTTDLGVYEWDLVSDRITANERFEKMVGVGEPLLGARVLAGAVHPDDRAWVGANLAHAMAGRSAGRFVVEHRLAATDPLGEQWVLSHGQVYFADPQNNHQATRVLGTLLDVSERKRADDVVRKSEERQAFLLGLSDALRPLSGADEAIEATSRHLAEHLEASRVLYFRVEGPPDGVRAIAASQHVREGEPFPERVPFVAFHEGEIGRTLEDGGQVVVANSAADARLSAAQRRMWLDAGVGAAAAVPLVKNGRVVAVVGAQQNRPRDWTTADLDIIGEVAERTWAAAERGRTEAALRESENRLQSALSISTVGIVFWGTGMRLTQANDAFLRFTGFTQEETIGKTWQELTPPEFHAASERAIEEVRTKGEATPYEKQHFRKDGSRWWGLFAPRRISNEENVEFIIDISERREAEGALRESEERFRQFSEATPDILWSRDAETLQWDYLSPAFEQIYGMDRAEALLGNDLRRWLEFILPEDRDTALSAVRRVREGERVSFEFRIRRHNDGAVRWIRNTDFPICDAEGRVRRIGGVGHDVTEMKATEAALTHSEQRLRTLVEGVAQLVWRAIGNGNWTWASPQWTAYTGQAEPDSHHLGWLEPVHPDDRDRAMQAWSHALQTAGFEVEYRIHRASDNAYRWFQTRAMPLRDRTGAIVEWLGTSTDIDDLRRLQESQTVMVAELQHRTRNLIAVVRSIAEDTMEHTGPTEAFRVAFADRLSALSRVQGLLSRSEAEPITIGALVRLELDALGVGTSNSRLTVEGPEAYLRPSSVQTLALALHELATNARKYGALSHERGYLTVRWREVVEPDGPRLALDWIEAGLEQAPERPALTPSSGGYGRELIEQALPHALGAHTTYALTEAGVRCTIDIPIRPSAIDGGQL